MKMVIITFRQKRDAETPKFEEEEDLFREFMHFNHCSSVEIVLLGLQKVTIWLL
jgi:hypothetical protein